MKRLLRPFVCAALWISNVSDPESGVKPASVGASEAGQKPGSHRSRRGKRKRKRGGAPASTTVISSPESISGSEASQDSIEAKGPDRKRRRRKRSRGGGDVRAAEPASQ